MGVSGLSLLGRSGFVLLPGPLGRFNHQALLDGICRNSHVAHFTVHDGFDPLQVGKETAFGDGRHVRADAAAFLRLTTTPNDAALNGAFAG